MILSLRFKGIIRISGIIFISGFIYYFFTQIGRDDSIYSGYTSPVWPAAGVALGLTLLLGNCAVFGIFLASFLSNSGTDLLSGVWFDIGKNLYLNFLIGFFPHSKVIRAKSFFPVRFPNTEFRIVLISCFFLFFSKRSYVCLLLWVPLLRCIF